MDSNLQIPRASRSLFNARVKTIEEIRHTNLLRLIGRYSTLNAFAEAIEINTDQVGQWKNKNKRSTGAIYRPDSNSARAIEQKLGLDVGWMDTDHEAWPFSRVDASRYDALDLADKVFVQDAMNAAISNCEARAGGTPHTGGSHSIGHQVHEQRKQFGT